MVTRGFCRIVNIYGVHVLAVKWNGDSYALETTAGLFSANNVVVASLHQMPHIPYFNGRLTLAPARSVSAADSRVYASLLDAALLV